MGNICKYSNIEESELDLELVSDYSKNEFQEIKEFRKEIVIMNIFERKKIAIKEYENFIKNKNCEDKNEIISREERTKKEYIKIKCLVLIDNTNKDIIKLYLNFIKKNDIFIKENKLDTYEKEINKYKVIFTIEEMKQIEPGIKTKSQKTIFLDYLQYLSSIDLNNNNVLQIKENAKMELKKLFLFNTPIEFDNMELYYYKCYYNLLLKISNRNDKKILKYLKDRKNVIKYILRNNLYNNPQITSNEDKMNLLFLFLLKELISDKYKEKELVNFNRLTQKIPVTKNDFEKLFKEDKQNKLKKIDDALYVVHKYSTENYRIKMKMPLENICLKNLKYFIDEVKMENYFNLDTLLINNEISEYIEDIKTFFINIIDSKVFHQAIKEIFPDYSKYLNSNKNADLKYYINKRIKFYPIQNYIASRITDKLSCFTYIKSINFYFELINMKDRRSRDAFIVSHILIYLFHEVYDAIESIMFFKGKNKKLFFSLINEENEVNEEKEELNFEKIMFGKNKIELNILECLYILNEDNYKQTVRDFRKNFKKIMQIEYISHGNTDFIKIKNEKFKKFYDDSTEEIQNIKHKLMYSTTIENMGNSDSEDNYEEYQPNKCHLLGGNNHHVIYMYKKNN